MPKRKASFVAPYGSSPAKLNKRTSSAKLSSALSMGRISKAGSVTKPHMTPLRFPSMGSKRVSTVTIPKGSSIAPAHDLDTVTPPSLRRASTLTLEEEKSTTSLAKKTSLTSKPVSLTKKPSSFVEEGALVTKLSGLKSGSIVGVTSMADGDDGISPAAKSLSRKTSSVKSSELPSIPSGLTKLAMPSSATTTGSLRVSKSGLISNVDESEIESALDTLRTSLSKKVSSMSKSLSTSSKKSSMSKSLSTSSKKSSLLKRSSTVKSSSGSKKPAEEIAKDADDTTGEADMDTSAPAGTGSGLAPPPNGITEVAISFDTTGSMYGVLMEVRAKIQDLVQRLQGDIPGIRIAIIAHGDYCDQRTSYLLKWIDFGASLPEICDFVQKVKGTGGGDGPECYELVLKRARQTLSWTPGSQRILVVIGDNDPHEPGYTYGGKTYNINWREECEALKEMGVKIYGVEAGLPRQFYKDISEKTGGMNIKLSSFSSMFDFIMMICYREANPDMIATYEEEMRARSARLAPDVSAFLSSVDPTSSKGGMFGTPFTATKLATPEKPQAKKTVTKKLEVTKTKKGKTTKTTNKPQGKTGKTKNVDSKKARKTKDVKRETAKKGVKALTKDKKRTLKKNIKRNLKKSKVLKREKQTDSCMSKGPPSALQWSKWIKVLSPVHPGGRSKFFKCRTQKGFTIEPWFEGGFQVPAIYEIAVQNGLKRSSRKYVVYYRATVNGFSRNGHWCTNLLRHKTVRAEVDMVMEASGIIYVRRGTVSGDSEAKRKKIQEAKNYIRDNFDYPWKKYIWRKNESGGQTHREVKIGAAFTKVVISHSSI